MLRIEPVRPRDHERAVALLVGGRDAVRRSEAFLTLLSGPDASGCTLWWACTLGRARAAAMTVRNPGKSAIVFHSPPRRAGTVKILARLLRELTEATLDGGAAFVQGLLRPDAQADAQAYLEAGYEYIAKLIYLRRGVAGAAEEGSGELTWTALGQSSDRELARVIADTYVDSQDCPGLLGLRRMEDVIAGHKSNGIFRPDSWFLPSVKGQTVGCVLVNDSAGRSDESEIVYLGVRPAWRRRGFGRAMVRHALAQAARRRRRQMCLAVDAANLPAVGLYRGEGFREVDRKDVYVRRPGGKTRGRR